MSRESAPQVPDLVAPFLGERYPAADLSALLAPPYDVISEPLRQRLAERDPHNAVHVILPAGDGDRYRRADQLLRQWRAEGALTADTESGVDVVQQEFMDPSGRRRVRTGVIGSVAAEPFSRGRVKPHERTHAGPKRDRLELLKATRTMCEALLMLARDRRGELEALLASVVARAPRATAGIEDVRVRLWRVTGSEAQRLCAAAGTAPLYLADGHHRYETAIAFRGEFPAAARTLALIVSVRDPGLVVLPTHRLLLGKPVPESILREALARHGVVETGVVSEAPRHLASLRETGGCVIMLEDRSLTVRRHAGPPSSAMAGVEPAVARLDVAWVDFLILPLLQEAAGSRAIGYASRDDEVLRDVQGGRAGLGVLLNPPGVDDVLAVADAAAAMPQKSTYFAPKVPSGMVMLTYVDSGS